MDVWIIKLGGSIITAKKTGHPTIKTRVVNRLCAEIAQAASTYADRRFVILHGAGSLGHPLVYAHDLDTAHIAPRHAPVISQIIRNMRQLSDTIANGLQKHNLNPIPLQTSSLLSGKPTAKLPKADVLRQMLRIGGIPILSGDLTITDKGITNVVSADTIAVQIAQTLPVQKIMFASDTPGVYATFPPAAHDTPIPRLSRQQLRAMTKQKTRANTQDVTGGMVGKLQALLPLTNMEAVILDGQPAGNLQAALHSKPIGTTIQL